MSNMPDKSKTRTPEEKLKKMLKEENTILDLECTKMAITIGIRKFVCLDTYPETDFGLLKEAGVEVVQLDKKNIAKWAKELVSKYENSV